MSACDSAAPPPVIWHHNKICTLRSGEELTRERVCFLVAVFTYGDRGTNVVGVFAAISAAVHIAELTRGREESRGGGGGGGGGRRRTISNRSLSGV